MCCWCWDVASVDCRQGPRDYIEHVADIIPRLGWHLEELSFHLQTFLFPHLCRHLSNPPSHGKTCFSLIKVPIVLKVSLVAHYHKKYLLPACGLDVLVPLREVVEGGELGDVVDDDCDVGITDVGRDQGPETLLTCGVPKLKLDSLVLKMHLLWNEVNSNGGLGKGSGYFE